MKLENNIGWADSTGNPIIGCRGCELGDRCYAKYDTPARVLRSKGIETFGPRSQRVLVKGFAAKLRRLNKLCVCDLCHSVHAVEALNHVEAGVRSCMGGCGRRLRRIRFFADSNSDWLDWPTPILAIALDAIRQATNVTVILSSKWPELWHRRMGEALDWSKQHGNEALSHFLRCWVPGSPPPTNITLLTSVLDQKSADRRIPALLKIPAARRGLSCEPLLDRINITKIRGSDGLDYLPLVGAVNSEPRLHWIIVGCESGKDRRFQYGYAAAARSIIQQCAAAGVPVWVKQCPVDGRVSRNIAEWPKEFRLQQRPHLT